MQLEIYSIFVLYSSLIVNLIHLLFKKVSNKDIREAELYQSTKNLIQMQTLKGKLSLTFLMSEFCGKLRAGVPPALANFPRRILNWYESQSSYLFQFSNNEVVIQKVCSQDFSPNCSKH
ncbi:hypothetical protein CV014_04920 [Nostoc sp. CMAA1605]|nr:hypothetical protein [Nostoc sp. CMAA1605]